ncbi:HAD family hydrolase [Poseidonocella sp. HB161398]|uniref:sulfotransferase-like domain-containing protein n=1 Tax=Poseidonocella sp. HB161398 TaxID=2320855 RepID=UPI0011099DC8|nr:HAD family hydrolase [Poseidonocella sp. HB161398]
MTAPLNIAAWSGPRNLSTAMMYAFGARGDAAVWDEPFYAAYLEMTGLTHPMGAEIIAAGPRDPREVAARCAAPHPSGRPVFYQKHMTHHMIEGVPRDWFSSVTHLFLIRHPARVLASYAKKRENPVLDDIGFRQQAEIFEEIRASGQTPVVIDSHDIRADPAGMMAALCDALGIPRDPGMIRWPAGGHADDGVWAAHWYDAVHRSTGFAGAEGPLPALPADLQAVCDAALPYYDALKPLALKA